MPRLSAKEEKHFRALKDLKVPHLGQLLSENVLSNARLNRGILGGEFEIFSFFLPFCLFSLLFLIG